jgi:hypothetical protein
MPANSGSKDSGKDQAYQAPVVIPTAAQLASYGDPGALTQGSGHQGNPFADTYTLPYPNAPHDGGPQDLANNAAIHQQMAGFGAQQYAIANAPTLIDKLALQLNLGLATAGIGGAVAPAASAAVGGGLGGSIAAGAATGAAGGALQSGLTGQNFGKDVLTGAATGALGGAAKSAIPGLSASTGIPAPVLSAVAKGALGGITGGLPGAVGGAASSLASSGLQETGLSSGLANAGGSYLGNQLGQDVAGGSSSPSTGPKGATMTSPATMTAGGPGGDPGAALTTGGSLPTNAYTAASPTTAALAPSGSGSSPDLSGLSGIGSAISGGLAGLAGGSGSSSILPYLAAGGLGMYQANQTAQQNQQYVNQINALGQPYTQAGVSKLNQGMSGTLTPQESNVVSTLNSQGQTLIDSASPLASIANTTFANYQAGQLNPGQQQQIDAWTASAKQQLAQTLSSSGVSDSSVLASQNAAIDSQATQLKANLMAQNLQVGDQQYAQWLTSTQAGQQLQAQGAQYAVTSINDMLSQAVSLGQTGITPQLQAVQTAIQQDAALSANVSNLFKSLASAYAVANKPAGATTGGGGGGGSPSGALGGVGGNPATAAGDAAIAAGAANPALARLTGGASTAVSSMYGQTGVPGGIQTTDPNTLTTPGLNDIASGSAMTNINFGDTGYQLNADNTVDTGSFDNIFYDPSSTDIPSIDFGP